MANVYGVANPNPIPTLSGTIGAADVAIPAGTETNFSSTPANLPTLPGWFYPAIYGNVTITFGATPPTLVNINCRLNNGADIESMVIHGGFYVANGSLLVPVNFQCQGTFVSNPSGTWNFQLSCTSASQGLTIRAAGTWLWCQWMRAPDQ